MKYCASNTYIVFNALKSLGGKSTSDKILETINKEKEFTKNTLSCYLGKLMRYGKICNKNIKGKREKLYFIPKTDISNIDNKTWVDIVFLIFKKNLSFEEISSVLDVNIDVVKEIFYLECLNNREMLIFNEKEKILLENQNNIL